MKIGVDIDGVLTNLEDYWMAVGSKYCYKKRLPVLVDPTQYDQEKMFSLTQEQSLEFEYQYLQEYVENTAVRPGAKEILAQWKQQGHEIFILTARNNHGMLHEDMQERTKEWLQKNEIPYDHLAFEGENKLTYCKQQGIQIMIEDSPYNIAILVPEIPVLCYNASYNQQVQAPQVTRVYTWYDIAKRIEEKNG